VVPWKSKLDCGEKTQTAQMTVNAMARHHASTGAPENELLRWSAVRDSIDDGGRRT
jgi:hypothetical protein